MKVLIYSDKFSSYAELAAGAKALGTESVAYFVGSRDDAAKIGAGKVYVTASDETKMAEDYLPTLLSLIDSEKPNLVLISATKRGKYAAAMISAKLGTSALTDLSNITVEGAGIKGDQMYYGGLALSTLKSVGATAVVTVGGGSFEAAADNAAGAVVDAAFVASASGIVRKECRKKVGETVDLTVAKRVVGVGRGILKKEDLAMIEALAKSIEAEVGCSRPIAEGEGWMSIDRYIGVSGIMIKPDIYFAIGISGQIQHAIGVNAAKTIVAINKDKNAPIFKVCDYGIVGDMYKIVPALTALIKP